MLPVSTFSMLQGSPEAGQILVSVYKGLDTPRLIFRWQDTLCGLALTGAADRRFTVADMAALDRPWLTACSYRLEIDEASALTGQAGIPKVGDTYLDTNGPGFIGKMNHSEVYISLAGQMLSSTPDWTSFVAFQCWRLVVDLPAAGEVFVLAQSSPPKSTIEII